MRVNNILRTSAWLITSIALNACATINSDNVIRLPVTEIFSAATCNISDQGITEIQNKEQLQEVLTKANAHRLNPRPTDLPVIEFKDDIVYLIALGKQPNAGYRIKKTGDEAHIKADVLHLPFQVQKPLKNRMSAQMMTSPCRIISLPAAMHNTVNIEGLNSH